MKLADYTNRPKPKRCAGSDPATWPEWDSYGCHKCGSRYHCTECGSGVGMMAHWIKVEDFEGQWCTLCQ